MKITEQLLFAVAPLAVCVVVYFVAPLWLFGFITEVWLIVGLTVALLARRKLVLILPITVFIWALLSFAFIGVGGRCPHGCQRDATRISDLRQIQNGLERYYKADNKYPAKLNDLLGISGITNIPKDPITEKAYDYAPNGDQSSYVLRAVLEDAYNFVLDYSATGTINGLDCNRPAYCVKL